MVLSNCWDEFCDSLLRLGVPSCALLRSLGWISHCLKPLFLQAGSCKAMRVRGSTGSGFLGFSGGFLVVFW